MDKAGSLSDIVGYRGLTREQKKVLWSNCVFVFDTNFLLNLYRYKSDVVEEFFEIWRTLKDRAWITGHIAIEFSRNREKVRREQKLIYDKVCGAASDVINDFVAQAKEDGIGGRHSYIDINSFEEDLRKIKDKFEKQVLDWKNQDKNASSEDPVLEKVEDLLEGRVYFGFDYGNIDGFIEEADGRFEIEMPPGYKDASKEGGFHYHGKHIPRKYGDLIIWKEILGLGKDLKKDVVFVTDDNKEDWWWLEKGQKIGPRSELVQEMMGFSKRKFDICSSASFIRDANEYKFHSSDKQTEDYVREVNEKLADAARRIYLSDERLRNFNVREDLDYLYRSDNLRKLRRSVIEFFSRETGRYELVGVNLGNRFDAIFLDLYDGRYVGVEVASEKIRSIRDVFLHVKDLSLGKENGEVDKVLLISIASARDVDHEKVALMSERLSHIIPIGSAVVFVQHEKDVNGKREFQILREISNEPEV